MTALIDFDSLLYTSVYKIVSIAQMREAIQKYGKESAKVWLKEEVYNEGINRCENELLKMINHLEQIFLPEITSYELFITTCTKSFRKELSTEYKAKRRKNDYVWMLREHYKFNEAHYSDTLEADDLIAERAKELGQDNYIIISIDKDLKQIGGWYWSYLKTYELDNYGDVIIDENGFKSRIYKYNEVEYISKQEAELFFWNQMLIGDAGDGVPGLHRVGKVTAKKILNESKNHFIKVAREYIKRGQKQDFYTNYKLLKLGKNE